MKLSRPQIRRYSEVKTLDVIRRSLLRTERFIKEQMNNGTEIPVTSGFGNFECVGELTSTIGRHAKLI